jgi:hypothetical protein
MERTDIVLDGLRTYADKLEKRPHTPQEMIYMNE